MLLSGFVTGALARLAVPGPDPMPAWLTILVGLSGSFAGFGIAYAAGSRNPYVISTAGFAVAIALVVAYRRFVQRRPVLGRDAYRFPKRGIGVDTYRERLHRAGIDPDRIGTGRRSPSRPRRRRRRPGSARSRPRIPRISSACSTSCTTRACSTTRNTRAARARLIDRLRALGGKRGSLVHHRPRPRGTDRRWARAARAAGPGSDEHPVTIGLGLAGTFLGGIVAGRLPRPRRRVHLRPRSARRSCSISIAASSSTGRSPGRGRSSCRRARRSAARSAPSRRRCQMCVSTVSVPSSIS